MTKLNPTMFREYDIRGKESEEELNEKTIDLLARAYGTFLKERGIKRVVAGHDNRRTSEAFYRVALAALTETGIDVTGIGLTLTPIVYWAQYRFEAQGQFMITASHNPLGWNGLKFTLDYSSALLTEDLQTIKKIAEEERFATGTGMLAEAHVNGDYIADAIKRVKLVRPLTVLVNTGNGTAGIISPRLLRAAGCTVIEHNTKLDPTFPHYPSNPANVHMLADTGKEVRAHRADIGVAIDADGDRLGITDEKGAAIWPDRYLILLSRLLLMKFPGSKIVFDVKVSEALPEDIRAHGGVPIMCKTGHSFIMDRMWKEKAVLAGEQSGHIFFPADFYGFDDANFAALKLLEYLSCANKPLSALVADTPYYISTPALHAHVDDRAKYAIVEKLVSEFKKEGYRVFDVNGARVYLEDGWGLVRASSNLPALVIRFEAKSKAGLEKIERIFRDKLKKFPEVGTKWDSA